MINIKRIRCDNCKKYKNVLKLNKEVKVIKDQIIEIIKCPICSRILVVTIIKDNFKYIEILGASS